MLNPGWNFKPADLDHFITYEMEEQKSAPPGPWLEQPRPQGARQLRVPDLAEKDWHPAPKYNMPIKSTTKSY